MFSFQERLIDCFGTVFPDLSREEIPRAGITSVAAWDSLATVTLVSVVEEEFGVAITPEDYDYMVSFELVRECLKDKNIDA